MSFISVKSKTKHDNNGIWNKRLSFELRTVRNIDHKKPRRKRTQGELFYNVKIYTGLWKETLSPILQCDTLWSCSLFVFQYQLCVTASYVCMQSYLRPGRSLASRTVWRDTSLCSFVRQDLSNSLRVCDLFSDLKKRDTQSANPLSA